MGAIRLPSNAFEREGTKVVTDILFLRKRAHGEPEKLADRDWLGLAPISVEGLDVPVNRYFVNHPEMVLGKWSRQDTLYGEGYSVLGDGDLAEKLDGVIARLPRFTPLLSHPRGAELQPAFTPPPTCDTHIGEGSFFIRPDGAIRQIIDGQPVPVEYGGRRLHADGTMTGKRLAALTGLRDRARRVLQSQNEDWPEAAREQARRALNWEDDRFAAAYGPINKTTFSETEGGAVSRRMPNLVKFREDPDAMLVMSLEDYDEMTG
ncbi:MAG: hypothetical protein SGJ19_17445 [Planctomycetia bacterium]|nr:hypothetical protein [Planctomycetia bacterium]